MLCMSMAMRKEEVVESNEKVGMDLLRVLEENMMGTLVGLLRDIGRR